MRLEKIWANKPGCELPAVPQWGQLIDLLMVAHTLESQNPQKAAS